MKLGQGYVFTCVCDSVHRGVCLSACWDTPPGTDTPSPGSDPQGADPPPEQTPPPPPPQEHAITVYSVQLHM